MEPATHRSQQPSETWYFHIHTHTNKIIKNKTHLSRGSSLNKIKMSALYWGDKFVQSQMCPAALIDAQNRMEKLLFLTSAFWTTGELSQGKLSSQAHPSTGTCRGKMKEGTPSTWTLKLIGTNPPPH